MQRLILHAGLHKTGSTYIQERLQAQRDALSEMGVLYPTTGLVDGSHQRIAEAAEVGDAAKLRSLLADLSAFPHPSIIISSENFDRLDQAGIELLIAALPKAYHLQVILFTRDRTDLLISNWQEEVKHGGLESFFEFVAQHLARPFRSALMNPCNVIRCYVEAIGRTAITVIDYDKARQAGDIFNAFAEASGLPEVAAMGWEFQTNTSYPLWEVEVLRGLNIMAAREGRLLGTNVFALWNVVRASESAALHLLQLESAIRMYSTSFDIRSTFLEGTLTAHLDGEYGDLLWGRTQNKPSLSPREVPVDRWMAHKQNQRSLQLLYGLLRERLGQG